MKNIIIGILLAFIGVYLKEAVKEINIRKKIATRLEGYINAWITDILNSPFKELYFIAKLIKNQEMEAIKKGKNEYLKQLQLYKDKLKTFDSALLEKSDKIKNIIQDIKKMRADEFEDMMHLYDEILIDFKNNKSFISDDEAVSLSWFAGMMIIELKSDMTSSLRTLKKYANYCFKHDNPDVEVVLQLLSSLIKSWLNVFKTLESLQLHAKLVREKPFFEILCNDFKKFFLG